MGVQLGPQPLRDVTLDALAREAVKKGLGDVGIVERCAAPGNGGRPRQSCGGQKSSS
jgi:hypothetical protein